MFISKKDYNKLKLDIAWNDLQICVLEKMIKDYCNQIQEVLDNNQSIIDTNKLVLDKIEEYLNEKISSE